MIYIVKNNCSGIAKYSSIRGRPDIYGEECSKESNIDTEYATQWGQNPFFFGLAGNKHSILSKICLRAHN